jgi:hypothetical protein
LQDFVSALLLCKRECTSRALPIAAKCPLWSSLGSGSRSRRTVVYIRPPYWKLSRLQRGPDFTAPDGSIASSIFGGFTRAFRHPPVLDSGLCCKQRAGAASRQPSPVAAVAGVDRPLPSPARRHGLAGAAGAHVPASIRDRDRWHRAQRLDYSRQEMGHFHQPVRWRSQRTSRPAGFSHQSVIPLCGTRWCMKI